MLFMVIERIKPENLEVVRSRFHEKGRMLPDGVEYHASWLTRDGTTCYQLMSSPRRESLDEWIGKWKDLVDFEVCEVQTSQDFWASYEAQVRNR